MQLHLRPLSRAEVRDLDVQAAQELGLPSLILMENAGRGAACLLAQLVRTLPRDAGGRSSLTLISTENCELARGSGLPKVLVICGPGNNGGDGGVVARHLDSWGFAVRVIWFTRSDQLRDAAAIQWSILNKSGIQQLAWFDTYADQSDPELDKLAMIIAETDWLVDGLLGIGLSRQVEDPLRNLIELMNDSGKPILALDVPSGLDADTGKPLGAAIRSTATATFVAAKLGFSAAGVMAYTGEVAIIDIGLPWHLLKRFHLP